MTHLACNLLWEQRLVAGLPYKEGLEDQAVMPSARSAYAGMTDAAKQAAGRQLPPPGAAGAAVIGGNHAYSRTGAAVLPRIGRVVEACSVSFFPSHQDWALVAFLDE